MGVTLFGVRHHGPGCARALQAALAELQPDIVLVEGPPDAHEALRLLSHEAMQPPVALLLYVPSEPRRSVYYPFTHFSPEWQALRYAQARDIPARFMDLPQAVQLAREPETPHDGGTPVDEVAPHLPTAAEGKEQNAARLAHAAVAERATPPVDPIALLSEAAGYSDHELWWEQQIEQRRDATGLFEGILEAMSALRSDLTPRDDEEAQREAHMRQTIRAALHEGFQRIAVVCGAWHSPALVTLGSGVEAKADAALLSGLKRVKVEATWIPWTNSRLSYRSGYGAGIASPGWYGHLWNAEDRLSIRWITLAAHLLREQGLDASSASVIEAVRLGDALAAMRGLPMAGMAELHEAIQTVLCNGDPAPMHLIRDKLEIGEAMGDVPPDAPAVPLQRDLEMQAKRLRMERTPEIKPLELDLRTDSDRAKSRLLHRLRLLGIEWGKPRRVYGKKKGTFHEYWQLKWEVEFAVILIEKNIWGNTLESAADGYATHSADEAEELPKLTELLDQVILAELPETFEYLLSRVQTRAAISADVRHLMDALPPLARVARYGNVRGTGAERVMPVLDALFERAMVGLPTACASLDDDAAAKMVESIDNVQESIGLLNRDDQRGAWQQVLRGLVERDGVHGLVRGRGCRLLLEQRAMDEAELRRLAGLALSPVTPAPQAAAWVEGVLRGSGLLLLHQDGLWTALDAWLADLAPDAFVALLPLLRRAFSGFHAPERRAMGEKVKRLRTAGSAGAGGSHAAQSRMGGATRPLDIKRASAVLPVLAHILGVPYEPNNSTTADN